MTALDPVFVTLIPITVLLLVIIAFSTYVFLSSNSRYVVRYLTVPISLAGAVAAYLIFASFLGFAYPAPLPDKFIYLHHQVLVVDGEKKGIEIWLKEKDHPSRLYLEPYSKPLEKALAEAGSKDPRGGSVTMEKGKADGGVMADADEYPFSVMQPRPSDALGKPPISGQLEAPLPPTAPMDLRPLVP